MMDSPLEFHLQPLPTLTTLLLHRPPHLLRPLGGYCDVAVRQPCASSRSP